MNSVFAKIAVGAMILKSRISNTIEKISGSGGSDEVKDDEVDEIPNGATGGLVARTRREQIAAGWSPEMPTVNGWYWLSEWRGLRHSTRLVQVTNEIIMIGLADFQFDDFSHPLFKPVKIPVPPGREIASGSEE